MFDLKWIRKNPEAFDAGLARRGLDPHGAEIIALDEERRAKVTVMQEAQSTRNSLSKQIGKAKGAGDEAEAQKLMDQVAELKAQVQTGEEAERRLNDEIRDIIAGLPNIPLEDVPDGADESENQLLRQEGEKPQFDFEPRQHFELGEALGMMDFETASRMSGARFVVLRGELARLERALASFMLDLHTREFGYSEVAPPFLVRDEALFGTAQLPKFADDLFRADENFWLIPTSEVPLTNLARESILPEAELPMRVTAHTPCFRSEAGSAGRDTRGMIRLHQFNKVELVSVVRPEDADAEHERMTSCAEEVLKRLGLAYQVMKLCTGDMGFSAQRTYDLEVWLPGQDAYREISSCSVCGDFQARRMNARYRKSEGKEIAFPVTLNGSGLAVGRTLVALLENYQTAGGDILIPEVLQGYMGGLERISAAGGAA